MKIASAPLTPQSTQGKQTNSATARVSARSSSAGHGAAPLSVKSMLKAAVGAAMLAAPRNVGAVGSAGGSSLGYIQPGGTSFGSYCATSQFVVAMPIAPPLECNSPMVWAQARQRCNAEGLARQASSARITSGPTASANVCLFGCEITVCAGAY